LSHIFTRKHVESLEIMVLNVNELQQKLEAFVQQQTGQPAKVADLKALAGGASRDTWLFSAEVDGQRHQLVLRRDLETSMFEDALEREEEFRVIQAAYENGVQVPQPRWYSSDSAILGKPFFIMDYIEGIAIGRKVVTQPELETARQALPEQIAEQISRIHNIDYKQHNLDFLPRPENGRSPAQQAIFQTRQMIESLNIINPAIEFGMRWLEQHAPACENWTLVHGDYRIGNLLVGPEGLNAILDWEFAHIGDPLEDLAWPCVRDWRFGNGHLRLGGISQREPFLEVYEQHNGRTIDRDAVDFWEIMGNMRWAVTCLSQAERHLSGKDPSIELASLGRRSAEMQLEVLRLIEEKGL
jgi:aminoglycoside phosphotransferase (APT) family kinase protein